MQITANDETAPASCEPIERIAKPTVFYDGACPLCEREIAFYKARTGASCVRWVDVSRSEEGEVAPGLSKDRALARFHVLDADGRLLSGGAAFSRLWETLPSFRMLGRLFQVPPLAWVLDHAYDVFLQLRPHLQAMMTRRSPRSGSDLN